MGRLSPPTVEGKIIGQTDNEYIKIPFLMNRGVGMADFSELVLIVKGTQSSAILTATPLRCNKDSIYFMDGCYYATFKATGLTMTKGKYYKAQIAYVNGDGIGFYSKAMIFKYTAMPQLSIEGLDPGQPNAHRYTYVGKYVNSDASEKAYKYRFNLYNDKNEIVATSGELLHNSSRDTDTTSSIDEWTVEIGIDHNRLYTLEYQVTTINDIIVTSSGYQIMEDKTVSSQIFDYFNFVAKPIKESACVELSMEPRSDKGNLGSKLVNGKFMLLRASSEDNFQTWDILTRFILSTWSTDVSKYLCKDYSVSQGVYYKYGLQAYNDHGLYSARHESPVIFMDFEDMFLSDGERQLRIAFNPKVSSFKNTILEQKIDTLGGKYPFFFRNGNVKYKEFPISGLISMIADENGEFLPKIKEVEPQRPATPSYADPKYNLPTMLTADNFKREREFKHAALEWLTNGKPKLFRSPGEGSFIVRLMNTSLSPNDTLGRMIHTFSCTAYEVDDFTFTNLRKYGILMPEYTETRDIAFYQVDLRETPTLYNLNAVSAVINGAPGTTFKYRLQQDTSAQSCAIGNTGTYVFDSEALGTNPLVEVWNEQEGFFGWRDATITYGTYKAQSFTNFSRVVKIDVNDVAKQWIGGRDTGNLLEDCFDIRKDIGSIHFLRIQKRYIQIVDEVKGITATDRRFYVDGNLYNSSPLDIIKVKGTEDYYDGGTRKKINNLDFTVIYNNEQIDLEGTTIAGSFTEGRIIYENIDDLYNLSIGNGVFVDILYQEVVKTYAVEETNAAVKAAKQAWEITPTKALYKNYCNVLEAALEREAGGEIIDAI